MNVSAQEYRMDNDSVVGFVTECITRVEHTGAATQLTTPSLYKTYVVWCGEAGNKPVGQIEFSKRMQGQNFAKGVRPISKISTNVFLGLQLLPEHQAEYDFNESMRVGVKHT